MEFNEELTLVRDTTATIIPAGEEQVLPAGTRATISQALGGTVTIRTNSGLFRLSGKDWDALGEAAKLELEKAAEDAGASGLTDRASHSGNVDGCRFARLQGNQENRNCIKTQQVFTAVLITAKF